MSEVRAEFGGDVDVDPTAIVGHIYDKSCNPATFAGDGTVRAGTIIYGDVAIGDEFNTGHDAKNSHGSITNEDLVDDLTEDANIIYHQAAQAGVRKSVEEPVKVNDYKSQAR